MDGVVVVDKPGGMTSHDVVDRVRKALHTRKVGHGGTLDPDATGVLLIGIGKATRLLSFAQAGTKRYTAVARFGVTTTTQDASGEIVEERPVGLTGAEVDEMLEKFRGSIEQIPPMVSAVKVGGERLYKKARRGESVAREPRRVSVTRLDLIEFSSDEQTATLDVECSGGTYIRTLVHDLGDALGCGAHLRSLRRTEAGGFTEVDALPLDSVDESSIRPLLDAVKSLPRIEVDHEEAIVVRHGRWLESGGGLLREGDRAAIVHEDELLAVYRKDRDKLVPDRVVGQ